VLFSHAVASAYSKCQCAYVFFSNVAMLLLHSGSQEQGASVWVCVRTVRGPACDVKDVKTDVLIGITVTSVNDVKKEASKA
jgi:hypothetical protein